jgi:hypothetical protein
MMPIGYWNFYQAVQTWATVAEEKRGAGETMAAPPFGGHNLGRDAAWVLQEALVSGELRAAGICDPTGEIVTMQPAIWRPLFTRTFDGAQLSPFDEALGMLARMLVVAPDSTAGTRMFKDRDASATLALADYDTRLRQLLEAPPRLKGNSDDVLDPEPLGCSAEARELWIAFHDFAEAAIGDGGEWRGIRAFGAKAAEHAGRLAAVLAAYAGEHDVSAEMMACGITLAQH